MFTCYVKTAQEDWNRGNSRPPCPPCLLSLFVPSPILSLPILSYHIPPYPILPLHIPSYPIVSFSIPFSPWLTNSIKVHHIILVSSAILIFISFTPHIAFLIIRFAILSVLFPTVTLGTILKTKIREPFVTNSTLSDTDLLGYGFNARSRGQVTLYGVVLVTAHFLIQKINVFFLVLWQFSFF